MRVHSRSRAGSTAEIASTAAYPVTVRGQGAQIGTRLRGTLGAAWERALGAIPKHARGAVVRLILRATPREARPSVAGRAAPVLDRDAYLPVLSGPLRGAKWIVHSSLHSCLAGDYEPETQRAFERHIAPGSVVFDVGANVGFLSLLAGRLVGQTGRVIAFEPAPVALAYLRRHVALNHATNVEVIAVAASDHNGRARFSSAGALEMGHLADEGDVDVETASLDTLVEAGIVPTPDVIKIDVEGAELAVLHGARTIMVASRPVLVLSTHGLGSHEASCSFLRSLGYTVTLLGHSLQNTEFNYLGELVATAGPQRRPA